jgi:eukaryotic-like serine/threonine-protein kinase
LSTYRIDTEIGRGGMAVVYAGWHEQLERPVALKVLAEHLAGDPEFRARFLREARIASKLHHPNLVQTFDITEVDGLPSIVMELVSGGTLEGGALTRDEAGQVAAGLAHAHRRAVVHRDLKPANLLRSATGQVKVADFGIARALEETMVTQIGTVLGTMRYLSPEQAEGRVVGTEADVYSLGVVFDELLDGATDSDRALIDRMRAHDPGLRPSADEVASALGLTENSVSENGTTKAGATQTNVTRVVPPKRTHRPGLATRTKVLAAGAAVAIVAAVAIATTGGSGTTRIEPVPHATTPAQQARNLSTWLKTYSR